MTDDIFLDGPYHSSVSSDVADTASWIHHTVINALWGFIALHLIAVFTYQIKGHRLIQSMLHGNKQTEQEVQQVSVKGIWWKCLLIGLICFAVIYTIVEVLPPEPDFYDY